MTQEEKNLKIKELRSKIINLKKLGSTVGTKKTIQKLQQHLDELTSKPI